MVLTYKNTCPPGASIYLSRVYLSHCSAPEARFSLTDDVAQGASSVEVKDEIKADSTEINKMGLDYKGKIITKLTREFGIAVKTNEITLPFFTFMERMLNTPGAVQRLSSGWNLEFEKVSPDGRRIYAKFANMTMEPKNGTFGRSADEETEWEATLTRNASPLSVTMMSIGQALLPGEYAAPAITGVKFTAAAGKVTLGTGAVLTDTDGLVSADLLISVYDASYKLIGTKSITKAAVATTTDVTLNPTSAVPKYVDISYNLVPGSIVDFYNSLYTVAL